MNFVGKTGIEIQRWHSMDIFIGHQLFNHLWSIYTSVSVCYTNSSFVLIHTLDALFCSSSKEEQLSKETQLTLYSTSHISCDVNSKHEGTYFALVVLTHSSDAIKTGLFIYSR